MRKENCKLSSIKKLQFLLMAVLLILLLKRDINLNRVKANCKDYINNNNKKPKFIYAIPDFQNPSGVTMDIAQRMNVIEVAKKFNLLIVEDSP